MSKLVYENLSRWRHWVTWSNVFENKLGIFPQHPARTRRPIKSRNIFIKWIRYVFFKQKANFSSLWNSGPPANRGVISLSMRKTHRADSYKMASRKVKFKRFSYRVYRSIIMEDLRFSGSLVSSTYFVNSVSGWVKKSWKVLFWTGYITAVSPGFW